MMAFTGLYAYDESLDAHDDLFRILAPLIVQHALPLMPPINARQACQFLFPHPV